MTPLGPPDRAAIRQAQTAALRALLEPFLAANPFYRRKWADAGLTGAPADLDGFSAVAPFTTKEELAADQAAAPPFGTNLTFPLERYTRFSQTSGTSGAPLRWLDTPESWSWMLDRWRRVLVESGVGPADRLFFAFSFGPFLGFWTAWEAALRIGCLVVPGGGMSSTGRLRTMLEVGVTVLCCTPTYSLRLIETAEREGIDLAAGRVRLILAAGEPGASIPATRAAIEAGWPGARLRDHHGMTEVGPVTYECPARPGTLHVMEEGYIPEIVRPDGNPAPPGEEGELVLTNLGRVASPLIRYRTGDRVQPGPEGPCACGRWELALEGGILGRVDDMVIVRGVNLHPSGFEAVLREAAGVREYRVEIDASGAAAEARVLLEGDSALAERVRERLRAAFHLRVEVRAVPVGALPRPEMKSHRWEVRRERR